MTRQITIRVICQPHFRVWFETHENTDEPARSVPCGLVPTLPDCLIGSDSGDI